MRTTRRYLKLLFPAALLARERTRVRRIRKMRRQLRQFTPIADLGSYLESRPRLATAAAKVPHAVLLLHGYSASPYEFEHLIRALDGAGMTYYAPALTGHGLDDFHLLYNVKASDWLRDAITTYDLLATLAEQISVVGHSTGATLAVYLAEHRAVRHLVLSGPNLFPGPADRRYKRILSTHGASTLIRWMVPVFAKPVRPGRVTSSDTLDAEAARRGFSYATLPLRSLQAQWDLQDHADITRARWDTLSLIYGAQDLTVDIGSLRRLLDEHDIPYRALAFANSAHNVLLDHDRSAAVQAIVGVLSGEEGGIA